MDTSGSFDRFTERARKALTLAQEEALRLNHSSIGAEHLLLALLREGEGVGARALSNLGIELTAARRAVELIIGHGERQVMGDMDLTAQAKKVIELAVDEARRLGHRYIGTEHLLLGLVREGDGIPAQVLESMGTNMERVRSEVIKVLIQTGSVPTQGGMAAQRTAAAPGAGWAYLAVPVLHPVTGVGGSTFVCGSPLPGHMPDRDLAGMPLHLALRLLGADGWELTGIDPGHGAGEESASLYIFKRRQ